MLSFASGDDAPFASCGSRRLRLGLFLACTALSAPLQAGVPTVAAAALPLRVAGEEPFQDPAIVAMAAEGVVVESPDDVYILEQRVVTSGDNAPAIFGRSTGGGVIVISGEAATAGDDSLGIFAEALGDQRDANVNAGTVITAGERSAGIVARSERGAVVDGPYGPVAYGNAVVTSQDVRTSGADASGISAQSLGGAALVTSNMVATQGHNSRGIEALGDAFTIVTSESVATAGKDAIGIFARSAYGAVTVDSGSVTTSGAGAAGIVADGYGNVTVVSGSIATSGEPSGPNTPAAAGIIASSASGNVAVESGSIHTEGRGASGIQAYAYGGVTITSDSVTTIDEAAKGIDVVSVTGAVTIDSGVVEVSGNLADGINVVSEFGRIDITSDAVTTRGDFSAGIKAIPGGSVRIDSGTVATGGDYAMGIEIFTTGGDVNVASDAVTTDGTRSTGISAVALASGGDIDIRADSVDTAGFSSDAIYGNAGSDLTIVAGSLSTRGEQSSGVFASAYDTISITAESIATEGPLSVGISAVASGGSVAIDVGSVTTSGDSSVGIYAGGLSDVTIKAENVVTSGDRLVRTDPATGYATYFEPPAGIAAYSYSGDIEVTADAVSTAGYGATGITAYSVFGTTAITAGDVVSTGGRAGGIRARGAMGATVIADTVHTSGYGVDAGAVVGEVLLRANSITTTGDYAEGAAIVSLFGEGRIETGTVSTQGNRSAAVRVLIGGQPGYSGDGAVVSGTATTRGDHSHGIWSEVYIGSASVESGTVLTEGYESAGINVLAGSNVTVTSGSVRTAGTISDGIMAVSQLTPFGGTPGSVRVDSEAVVVTGDSSRGIVGLAEADVTITSGSVATSGATAIVESLELVRDENGYYSYEVVLRPGPRPVGILAESTRGAVTITSASVTTSGEEAHGIHALTDGGAITIASGDVRVTGVNANAIRAESGSGDIAIAIDGDVSASRGPAVEAVTGGVVRVDVVDGGVLRSEGNQFALVANGASADVGVATGGTLRGSLSLTNGADLLEVDGSFDARGDSRFGAGEDLLDNRGLIAARSGTARFVGLERLRNAGLVSLSDDSPDDVLDLAGTAFEGTEGSAIQFDVVAGEGGDAAADRVILGDVSGVTAVQIAFQGVPTLDTRADLVTISGDSPANAFVLDPQFADAGFLRYRLVGVGSASIALATAPDREVFEATRMIPAASSLWRHGAEAWAAQRLTARDAGEAPSGHGFWGQAFTGDQGLDDLRSGTTFDGEALQETISTREKFSGLQVGGDIIRGAARLGVTGGFGATDARLRGGDNRIKADGFNLGVYGGWSGGPLFIDLLTKIDFAEIELDARSAGVRRQVDASIFGLRADAGLRLGGRMFFAEPIVSLAWTHASVDDFEVEGAEFRLGNGTSLLGQAGLRVGGKWTLRGGYTLTPSAGLFAVKELGDGPGLAFQSGSLVLAVDGGRPGTFGRGEAGLTLSSGRGWDAFLRGQGDFAGGVSGTAVRAGFNWRW